MQLEAIVIYSNEGETRVVELRPGELNVVTGVSATGKSALLDIVEFCLGRRTVTMPVGPITASVAWYAVVLRLSDQSRAFVARPAPDSGAASTQRAMLELGVGVDPLPFEDLAQNADAATVREQLGRLIGIEENAQEGVGGHSLEANLGHAVLLCLQGQGEIANRDLLFHRQGEDQMKRTIQATLPYFLGAIPRDQVRRQQELLAARRDLRRAEGELEAARQLDEDVEVELRGLLSEAYGRGLTGSRKIVGREEILETLRALAAASGPPEDSDPVEPRQQELERSRDGLRRSLRELADERALLLGETGPEDDYTAAIETQLVRLSSLGLLADSEEAESREAVCPICGSDLPHPDPSAAELHESVIALKEQLKDVQAARPRRDQALAQLTARADELTQELAGIEDALAALAGSQEALEESRTRAEEQAYTRGRIAQYLSTLSRLESSQISELQRRIEIRQRAVDALEDELDPDEEREQLTSRLAVVGEDMTAWAERLELEHGDHSVRLDLRRLTVVADTDEGPAPLFRIGSAENWVGYHLIAHLALHRYFVRQDRPVPRLLMLDQPTQAYYPSEIEQREGLPEDEDDRAAVRRMFELIRDVTEELSPNMQVVVCDHANLPEPWFQAAVRHNWRDGRKLVPDQWAR